jgi:hypothetical protein
MPETKVWVLIAASVFLFSATAPSQIPKAFAPEEERELRRAVLVLNEAILRADVRQVLQQISSEGLTCTDTRYTREKVRAFLGDHQSHLYMSLFDTARFSQQCGREYPADYPAISERDFLRTANASMMIVRFDTNWAQVTLTSSNRRHYPREWSFHKENGRWKIAAGSWIVGRCSCG